MSFSLFVQTDKKGYQHKLADSGTAFSKELKLLFFNESLCSVTKHILCCCLCTKATLFWLVSMTVRSFQ